MKTMAHWLEEPSEGFSLVQFEFTFASKVPKITFHANSEGVQQGFVLSHYPISWSYLVEWQILEVMNDLKRQTV